jgi:hypothetical protein
MDATWKGAAAFEAARDVAATLEDAIEEGSCDGRLAMGLGFLIAVTWPRWSAFEDAAAGDDMRAAAFMVVLPREAPLRRALPAADGASMSSSRCRRSRECDQETAGQAAQAAAPRVGGARGASQLAKSTASTPAVDPAVLAMGLQLVRVVVARRLIPLLVLWACWRASANAARATLLIALPIVLSIR